jgi:hypothetical protein
LDDALVTAGLAFNVVLEYVLCFGEQANDFEVPSFCVFPDPDQAKTTLPGQPKIYGRPSYLSA